MFLEVNTQGSTIFFNLAEITAIEEIAGAGGLYTAHMRSGLSLKIDTPTYIQLRKVLQSAKGRKR